MLDHAVIFVRHDRGGPFESVLRDGNVGELGVVTFGRRLDPMCHQSPVAERDHFGQFGGLTKKLAVRGDGTRAGATR